MSGRVRVASFYFWRLCVDIANIYIFYMTVGDEITHSTVNPDRGQIGCNFSNMFETVKWTKTRNQTSFISTSRRILRNPFKVQSKLIYMKQHHREKVALTFIVLTSKNIIYSSTILYIFNFCETTLCGIV